MQASLLQEGKNCWKITEIERLAVLMDAAAFYTAFAKVAEQAQEYIFILAWDIDWRTCLIEESEETFAEFLLKLVNRNSGLHINILEWDFAMIYARERCILPMFGVGLPSHRRIHYHKDEVHPVAGSHHQKIIVVDDQTICPRLKLKLFHSFRTTSMVVLELMGSMILPGLLL